MSRFVLTLALALLATACAPATEPRTVIAAGPRVVFDDDLRASRNWAAGAGTICRSRVRRRGLRRREHRAVRARACSARCARRRSRPACASRSPPRLRKGTREGAFGLMFASRGGSDNRTFATFGLTANGTYRVASWSGGKWNYPVPPTATRSVKTEYGAPNTLAVELRDRSIVAYVNGRPVATAELAAEASGTLGLYVDQRGMEVLFTNLRVSELAPIR